MSTGRRAWGFSFEFRIDDADLASVASRCFGDLPKCDTPAASFHVARRHLHQGAVGYDITLHEPGKPVVHCAEGAEPSRVMTLLAWEVNGRARASMAHATVLHAAVCGGPAGAVVLCGASESGKSTLAAAAAERGWVHFSDDLALVTTRPDGVQEVHPYARPLMLRAGGRSLLGVGTGGAPGEHEEFFGDDVFVAASDLGASVTTEPAPVTALVFLSAGDGDGAGDAVLSRADTLYRLTMHSATLRDRGASGFDDLHRLAAQVPGRTLGRRDPQEMLDRLAPLLGG